MLNHVICEEHGEGAIGEVWWLVVLAWQEKVCPSVKHKYSCCLPHPAPDHKPNWQATNLAKAPLLHNSQALPLSSHAGVQLCSRHHSFQSPHWFYFPSRSRMIQCTGFPRQHRWWVRTGSLAKRGQVSGWGDFTSHPSQLVGPENSSIANKPAWGQWVDLTWYESKIIPSKIFKSTMKLTLGLGKAILPEIVLRRLNGYTIPALSCPVQDTVAGHSFWKRNASVGTTLYKK